MDGPRNHHTEWSKSDKDEYIWYHIYMESKWTYLKTHRLSDTENKLRVTKGERVGGILRRLGITYIYTIYKIDHQ